MSFEIDLEKHKNEIKIIRKFCWRGDELITLFEARDTLGAKPGRSTYTPLRNLVLLGVLREKGRNYKVIRGPHITGYKGEEPLEEFLNKTLTDEKLGAFVRKRIIATFKELATELGSEKGSVISANNFRKAREKSSYFYYYIYKRYGIDGWNNLTRACGFDVKAFETKTLMPGGLVDTFLELAEELGEKLKHDGPVTSSQEFMLARGKYFKFYRYVRDNYGKNAWEGLKRASGFLTKKDIKKKKIEELKEKRKRKKVEEQRAREEQISERERKKAEPEEKKPLKAECRELHDELEKLGLEPYSRRDIWWEKDIYELREINAELLKTLERRKATKDIFNFLKRSKCPIFQKLRYNSPLVSIFRFVNLRDITEVSLHSGDRIMITIGRPQDKVVMDVLQLLAEKHTLEKVVEKEYEKKYTLYAYLKGEREEVKTIFDDFSEAAKSDRTFRTKRSEFYSLFKKILDKYEE